MSTVNTMCLPPTESNEYRVKPAVRVNPKSPYCTYDFLFILIGIFGTGVSTPASLAVVLSSSSSIAFSHSFIYSEFIASLNVDGTLSLMGDTTGRTAFSKPYLYSLLLTLPKAGTLSCFAAHVCLMIKYFNSARFLLRLFWTLRPFDFTGVQTYRRTTLPSPLTLGSLSDIIDCQNQTYRRLRHYLSPLTPNSLSHNLNDQDLSPLTPSSLSFRLDYQGQIHRRL